MKWVGISFERDDLVRFGELDFGIQPEISAVIPDNYVKTQLRVDQWIENLKSHQWG